MNKIVHLALFGMDQRSKKLIELTLKENLVNLCNIVEPEYAEAALIDMDGPNANEQLELLRTEYSNIPVIVTSIQPKNIQGCVYLRKPLSIPSLLNTFRIFFSERFIQQVSNGGSISMATSSDFNIENTSHSNNLAKNLEMHKSYVTSGQVVTLGRSDQTCFDPSEYVIWPVWQAMLDAESKHEIIKITLWNNKTIVINSNSPDIFTDLTDGNIRSIGVVSIDKNNKVNVEKVSPAILDSITPKTNSRFRQISKEAFIWLLAIHTARGRIPVFLFPDRQFEYDKPVYLRRWPNFSRLPKIADAIRVCAFWIKHPLPLRQLATKMQVEKEQVHNLFFACAVINLTGQAMRQSDMLLEVEHQPQHKLRNLFGSLLNHLRKRDTAEA